MGFPDLGEIRAPSTIWRNDQNRKNCKKNRKNRKNRKIEEIIKIVKMVDGGESLKIANVKTKRNKRCCGEGSHAMTKFWIQILKFVVCITWCRQLFVSFPHVLFTNIKNQRTTQPPQWTGPKNVWMLWKIFNKLINILMYRFRKCIRIKISII